MGRKILRVLGWCAAVLLGLTAVTIAPSSAAASLLMLVTALAALPPVWSYLVSKGYRVPIAVRCVAGFVAFVLAAIAMPTKIPPKSATAPVRQSELSAPPPIDRQAEEADTARALAREVAARVAGARKIDAADVQARLTAWKGVVDLAPGNAEYRATLQVLEEKQARIDELRENPEEGIILVKVDAKKVGFGNVLRIDVTLRNESPVALKDFPISCVHRARSGTVIDQNNETLYERLGPGETRKFRNFDMGFIKSQAASTNCRVAGATVE